MFVDERFINKAHVDARFAHGLILKDKAVPAIKDPGHDSELLAVNESASYVRVFAGDRAQVLITLYLRPRCAASRSSAFFGKYHKAVSFFYKYDKTKDFLEI